MGSIVIGQPSTITSVQNDTTNTTYVETMNLLVADSNGNPVSGAVVSLNTWPVAFYTGDYPYVSGTAAPCYARTWAEFPNEDTNRSLIYNAAEDLTGPQQTLARLAFNPAALAVGLNVTNYIVDNVLTPAPAAAGTVPATVTTDSNGLATFNLIYLKQYASWVSTQLTAKTVVQGTEATSSLTFTLPASQADMNTCVLAPSPFNP